MNPAPPNLTGVAPCEGKCSDGGDVSLYDDITPIVVKLNFHFVLDENGAGNFQRPEDDPTSGFDGVSVAQTILNGMNATFANLEQNNLGSSQHLLSAGIQFELYTESTNTNDQFGGIWFWNDDPANDIRFAQCCSYNTTADLKDAFSQYNDMVVDIVFNENQCDFSGRTGLGITTDVAINICGMFLHHITIGDNENIATYTGTVAHELMHVMGLHHTTHCQALDIPDLDPAIECNTPPTICTTSGSAGGNMTGSGDCNDVQSAGGNNIVGSNLAHSALTPCQAEVFRRHLLANQPPFMSPFCALSGNDLVIETGEHITWNISRFLDRNIVIEPDASLTVRCIVGMPEGSKITVMRGGVLNVDCGTLTSVCGERWEGVTVQGNSLQHQSEVLGGLYQGFCSLQNAVIENAIIGVRLYDDNLLNSTGGLLVAENSTFHNNIIDVSFGKYQNHHPVNGTPTGNLSSFSECTFLVDDEFIGDIGDFEHHVSMRQVTGIDFYGCTFANDYPNAQLASADMKGYGIFSSDAGFNVTAKQLPDPGPCDQPCLIYKNSQFRGLSTGVAAVNKATVNTFRISRTDFIDNAMGVAASRVDNIYMVLNTFQVGMDLPWQSGNPFIGVQIFRGTGYMVEENEFTVTDLTIPAGIQTIGSHVSASGNQANEIYKNSYAGLDYGNLTRGDNRGIESGLQFKCNDNSENNFDFAVPMENSGGEGIAQFQGTAAQSAGNTFSSPPPNPETHFLNQEAPITYFWPEKPTAYTGATITLPLDPSAANTCPSRLPDDKDGYLSEEEENLFENEFDSSNEITIKTNAANMLIRQSLVKEEQDLANVRTWLANKGDLESHFAIVDSWLQEANVSSAQLALDNIPVQFTLDNDGQAEYSRFSTLKTLQIEALQAGQTEAQMVANNQTAITQLAEGGDHYVSAQAQNLLNEWAGAAYRPLVVFPTPAPQGLILPPPSTPSVSPTKESQVYVRAIPNPARRVATFFYNLPEGTEDGALTITTLDGREVWSSKLEGQSGRMALSLDLFQNGIYLYKLQAGGRVLKTEKLVVTK